MPVVRVVGCGFHPTHAVGRMDSELRVWSGSGPGREDVVGRQSEDEEMTGSEMGVAVALIAAELEGE